MAYFHVKSDKKSAGREACYLQAARSDVQDVSERTKKRQ